MNSALLPLSFIIPAAAVLGACFGSFSNVLVYRLPRNLSVVGPRSFCPSCKKTVAWYDNIPLLSWFLLRGKCRYCSTAISPLYLILEAAGALLTLVALWRLGNNVEGAAAAFYLLLLLNIAIIDWQHMIIPHTLTITGMLTGLAFSIFTPLGIINSALGMLLGAGIILAVSYGYKLMRGVVGMGGGDVMLMGMVGAYQGIWAVPAVLFGGAIMGTLYALTAGRGQVAGQNKLPFGTFLAAAAVVVLFAGDWIWSFYMGLF
ncbi:MAG: prepilin peptidase [bacterium]|nr:prepilin peptidase [bacterium]